MKSAGKGNGVIECQPVGCSAVTCSLDMQVKNICRERLSALIEDYKRVVDVSSREKVSEETVRTWLNEFLSVFGWDVRNVSQVWQEAVLDERNRRRLESINSTHKRPDYTLLSGSDIKTFLDAKSLSVDVFASKAAAFHIRVLEERYIAANCNRRGLLALQLDMCWNRLDEAAETLYGLSPTERRIVHREGRSVPRVNLLPKG